MVDMELVCLFEESFTNFWTNAMEKLFDEKEINELIGLAHRLTI
jgi:hypothetical protein